MPRVLIVADLFPPGFGPRPGALSKYLPRLNWEVDVVAFDRPGAFILPGSTPKEKVTWVQRVPVQEEIASLKHWPQCLRLMNPLRIELLREGLTLKNLQDALFKRVQVFNPDVLLGTTSGSVALIRAVATVAKFHKKPWVGDVRDLLTQAPVEPGSTMTHRFHYWAATRRLLQFLPEANGVTTISAWHKNYIENRIHHKVDLVFNGYDPDLFDPCKHDFQSEKFRITFVGTFMFSKEFGNEVFFEACAKLIKDGIIHRNDLDIAIYSHSGSKVAVREFAKHYGIQNEISINDSVPHTAIPRILQESTLLVVLTSNHRKGIMGTKVYEYLAIRKPILCIPRDDGSISNLLKSTNAGFSASTIDEVANLIKLFYEKWKRVNRCSQK